MEVLVDVSNDQFHSGKPIQRQNNVFREVETAYVILVHMFLSLAYNFSKRPR
jgi:hypothetical protein